MNESELPLLETESPERATRPTRDRTLRAVTGVAVLAFAIRVAIAPFVKEIHYLDAILFDFECIRAFARGEFADGYLHWVPPLFPVAVALPYRWLGDLEWAGRLTSCAIGAATVFPVYGLGRLAVGPRVGVVAALLLAVAPYHVGYSVEISSHVHYVFYAAFALWAGFGLVRRPSWRSAVLFGAAAGVAYWVRQEIVGSVLVIAAIVVLLPVVAWRFPRVSLAAPSWPRAIGIAVLAGAVCFGYAFPIVWWTHEATGRWVISSKGGVSLFARGRVLTELTADHHRVLWETQISTMEDQQRLSLIEPILEDPVAVFRWWSGCATKHVTENLPRVFGYALTPFIVLAWWVRRRVPRGALFDLYGGMLVLGVIAQLSFFYDSPRLLLAFLPLGMVWGAVGLIEVGRLGPFDERSM
ncbi:MAG: glycosyltransferase family 39 protein, partial [Planctomycetes bacterium]|nr:glycosyltransferase family 39 protein [Planctomycetota bacterium]